MNTQINKYLIIQFFLIMFVTGCTTSSKQTEENNIQFD